MSELHVRRQYFSHRPVFGTGWQVFLCHAWAGSVADQGSLGDAVAAGFPCWYVDLLDSQGRAAHSFERLTFEEACDRYQHPFAGVQVPHPFGRETQAERELASWSPSIADGPAEVTA